MKMKESLLLFLATTSLLSCEVNPQVAIPEDSPVYTAKGLLGLHEREDREELKAFLGIDPYRVEWCAAFVNQVLAANGIPGSESVSDYPLTARSFLSWGERVDEPMMGDVIVFPRGNSSWQGHVGFYITTSLDGKYYFILGGNQSDSVSIEAFRASSALGIRRSNSGLD